MFKKVVSLFLCGVLAFSNFFCLAPAFAQNAKSSSIAVLDMDANGLSQTESRSLSDYLRGTIAGIITSGEYRKKTRYVYSKVLERSQMDKIFDQFNIQNSGCTSDSCAIEFGKMLNVDRIVIGSVGLVGQTYTIQSRIVDVQSSEIVAVSNYMYRGERDNLLKAGIPKIVNELLYGRTAAPSHKKWYIFAGMAILGGAISAAVLSSSGNKSSGDDNGTVGVTAEFPE
jgi:hypothetical protein